MADEGGMIQCHRGEGFPGLPRTRGTARERHMGDVETLRRWQAWRLKKRPSIETDRLRYPAADQLRCIAICAAS
jgi:hypothetical protein